MFAQLEGITVNRQLADKLLHIRRQGSFQREELAAERMGKGKPVSMQRLPVDVRGGAFFVFALRAAEIAVQAAVEKGVAVVVEVVAGDGVADGGHVHSDLMRAAGLERKLDQRMAGGRAARRMQGCAAARKPPAAGKRLSTW